ncbi:MAG: efflux RND transporter periplasmic adaptor subunit [Steroidobacteraceae bacterium]
MSRRGKWLLALVVAALIAVPAVLRIMRGGEVKQVQMEPVATRIIAPTILASGSLTYQTEIRLVSEVIGRVQEILVKEGDQVKQGELLLRLDPATTRADVAQLEAVLGQSRLAIERQRVQLATLETRYQRYEQLRGQGLVDANTFDDLRGQRDLARVELDSARENLRQTEAQLNRARELLAKTEVRAPISGRVTSLTIKIGETAVPSVTSIAGSDLMVVADTSNLYAEVNVNETDVARVQIGQEARIVPAAFPDTAWKGVVEAIAVSPRQLAGQSKTYPVKIRLQESTAANFHTGMSCRAEIITRNTDAEPVLAAPVQALRYEEKPAGDKTPARASLFIEKAGRVAQSFVETGTADDAWIAITKGVAVGDRIVTGPARVLRFLRDGDRVTLAADVPVDASSVKASPQ